jgi:hypothetical protein
MADALSVGVNVQDHDVLLDGNSGWEAFALGVFSNERELAKGF